MTNRHIMISNNIYPPFMAGGAELIVAYLAEELARRGNRVTVVSTCGPQMEPYPVEHKNGVEILRFFPKNLYWHWERTAVPGYKKALWHLRDAWNTDTGRRFRTILSSHKPDILHTHLIDGLSPILWRRAQQAGVGVVHTAHDYHIICPRSVMLTRDMKICNNPKLPCQIYRHWHLSTTKDVDLFCSPSQFLIDKHIESGLQATRTQVVRNGIPLPAPQPKLRQPGAPCRFLFPARHTVEKGCLVLIEAIKRLPADLNAEFMIAGKGVLEDKFKEAAAADPRIRILGFISGPQKEEAFRAADCILVPSLWYENAPVVIVEAAAYGLGVIGSDIGAIPEFVRHEKTGLLFEPGNPDSLAAAITRIVREGTPLLERFAQEGQALVAMSSVEKMADAYQQEYERVIADRQKKAA